MKKKRNNRIFMIKGYLTMSRINRELADEANASSAEALSVSEKSLTESEEIDSQKRGYILRRS